MRKANAKRRLVAIGIPDQTGLKPVPAPARGVGFRSAEKPLTTPYARAWQRQGRSGRNRHSNNFLENKALMFGLGLCAPVLSRNRISVRRAVENCRRAVIWVVLCPDTLARVTADDRRGHMNAKAAR